MWVYNQIHFPVTESFAVSFSRSLMYADAVRDIFHSRLYCRVTFPMFHAMPCVRCEFSGLIRSDGLIDTLMGDSYVLKSQNS